MADAQLEILIEAQAAAAKAELQSLGKLVNELSTQHQLAGAAAQQHSNYLTMFEAGLGKVGSAAKSLVTTGLKDLASGVENLVGHLASAINPLSAFSAGLAGIGAAFGIFELANKAMQWDQAIERLTPAMNGNATAASSWLAIGERFGVQTDTMTTEIDRFSKNLDKNQGLLHQLGVATVDSSGHLLDMNTILLNVSDALRRHAGSTQEAALAMDLFGRGGSVMLPILLQQRDVLEAVAREAAAYGLVLSGPALEQQQAYAAEVANGEFALKGFTTSLGNALLTGVGPLANALTAFITGPGQNFVKWVREAISDVASFISGVFGVSLQIDPVQAKIAAATASVAAHSAALQTGSAAAKDYSGAEKGIQDAAKATTEALDAQIRKVQDQQTAFADAINAQIKALQDATAAESFNDKQAKLRQQLADKQLAIAKDQQDEQFALYYGDYQQYSAAQQALTTAKQDSTNLQSEYQRNADDQQRQSQIDALKAEEDARKKHTDFIVRQLEDEKKAVQDAAQKQVEALQKAAQQSTDAIAGATSQWPGLMQGAGSTGGSEFAVEVNKGAEQAGKNVRAWLDSFKKDPGGHLHAAAVELGKLLGQGIEQGMMSGLGDALKGLVIQKSAKNNAISRAEDELGSFFNALGQDLSKAGPSLPSFDTGGVIPGALGAPQLVQAHGGEVVLNREQQAALSGGTGDPVIRGLLRSIDARLAQIAGESAPAVGHLAGAL